jgi:hypothetical protein
MSSSEYQPWELRNNHLNDDRVWSSPGKRQRPLLSPLRRDVKEISQGAISADNQAKKPEISLTSPNFKFHNLIRPVKQRTRDCATASEFSERFSLVSTKKYLTSLPGSPDTLRDRTNHRYFIFTTILTSYTSLYLYISISVMYSGYFWTPKTPPT